MKYQILIITLLNCSFVTIISQSTNSFNQAWYNMQKEYSSLIITLSKNQELKLKHGYIHPYWRSYCVRLRKIITSKPTLEIWPCVSGTMIRGGFKKEQQYEVNYLKNNISQPIYNLIKSYQDTNFNTYPFECRELNCSTNTLGHLYYAAYVFEHALKNNHSIKKIVEFGGGYGNLARIFKHFEPASTIFLIDLPEFIALQYLFLTSTLPSTKTIIHSTIPETFEEYAIHLLPIQLIEKLNIPAELFISTFGISETPIKLQSIIANKNFFDARLLYISGQLDELEGFANHNYLHNVINKQYNNVKINKFHIPSQRYEICAIKGQK